MRVIFLVLASVIFSCGPNYHLKRSEVHLRKAMLKGAKVKRDTVYKLVPFKFPGAKFSVKLQPLEASFINVKDTLTAEGNGATTKLKIELNNGCPEDCVKEVYVYTDCPDVEGEIETAVSVSTEVSSPRGFWYWFQFMVVAYILGAGSLFAFLKFKPR